MYRDIKLEERIRGAIHFAKRTEFEQRAYMLLPKSMRVNVERNPTVAFPESKAYYPDLFMVKEKICIEIDGGYHNMSKRMRLDAKRDNIFRSYGYTVIRIKNEDVRINVVFWQRLVEGLENIESGRPDIQAYVNELHQMIDTTKRSWTEIDPMAYGDILFFDDCMSYEKDEESEKRKRKNEDKIPPVFIIKLDENGFYEEYV